MQEASLARREQSVAVPEHTPGVKEQPRSEVQVRLSELLAHVGGVPVQLPVLGVPLLLQPAASEIDTATNNVIVQVILVIISRLLRPLDE
jgi:hypothetical protein